MTNKKLREEIKKLRWQNKVSYKSTAERLGISPDVLYTWLSGRFNFIEDKIIRYSAIVE